MPRFQCEVSENLSRIIVIDAPTEEAALKLLKEKYNEGEINLADYDILGGAEFKVLEDEVPADFETDYTVEK